MNKLSIVFVAGLAVAGFGCKKKGGGDCSTAINHSMELSKADMAKMPGMDDKMMEKMKDIGLQHCKDDKWSDDVIKCMTDAKTEADSQACYGKLTKDQQDKMNAAAMAAAQAQGNGPAATGSAGAATGGDMAGSAAPAGSAMAGSAMAGSAMAGSATAGSGTATGSAGSAAAPK